MSINLIVAVEQEDHGNEIRPMCLTRFMRGITGTADVHKGDYIDFDGLSLEIRDSFHKYSTGQVAPVTDIHGTFHRPLADFEIDNLIRIGFRDLGSDGFDPETEQRKLVNELEQ